MTSQKLAFQVDGEHLTDLSRDLVMEGRWEAALNILVEGLIGFTHAHALDVLKGYKRLEGVNDLALIPETPENVTTYIEQVQYLYEEYVFYQGKWYTPYVYIKDWGRDKFGNIMTEDGCARAMEHYAVNFSDHAEIIPKFQKRADGLTIDTVVIFELTGKSPPFWHPVNTCFKKAAENSKGLMEDGYSIRNPPEPKKEPVPATDAEKAEARIKEKEEREAEAFEKRMKRRRKEILAQSEKMYEHEFPAPVGTVQIPYEPLYNWAMGRTGQRMEWVNICPSGLKMYGDDPNHTDWIVGAGIDLHTASKGDQRDAQFNLMFKLQRDLLNLKVAVLVKGKPFACGTIIHPKPEYRCTSEQIAVIPHAGVEYYDCVRNAAAVITEKGGRMSHLSVVGLEEQILLMRMKEARKNLREGTLLSMDAGKGRVEVMVYSDDNRRAVQAKQIISSMKEKENA